MKIRSILSSVQIALLIVLLIEVTDQKSTARIEYKHPTASADSGAIPFLDAADLRLIIREEIASLAEEKRVYVDEIEDRARTKSVDSMPREPVEEQLDYYRGIGEISDAQMESLLAEIARLDGADRNQMTSKLMRALNAGEIDGTLL
jgi:hypothetical protein